MAGHGEQKENGLRKGRKAVWATYAVHMTTVPAQLCLIC
jgi:hypothetical protein